MANDNLYRMKDDIASEQRRQDELERSIKTMEQRARRDEQRVQAATNDIERAKENLRKQESDLKRVLEEKAENDNKLQAAEKRVTEHITNVTDLKRKLEQITRELKLVEDRAANTNRKPEQRRSGSWLS